MRIITEMELRDAFKIEPFTEYSLPAGVKLTPAARQFLTERRIEISEEGIPTPKSQRTIPVPAGEKPEECTHLNGQELVPKCHPKIRFRGLVDSLYAALAELELLAGEKGMPVLTEETRILRKYSGQIQKAEVTGQLLPFIDFYGWSPEEIRNRSHYPQKYYGVGHFRAHPKNGMMMIRLNQMRTRIRELEVVAVEVYGPKVEGGGRSDLVLALNRLSSVIYIMMCRLKANDYEREVGSNG